MSKTAIALVSIPVIGKIIDAWRAKRERRKRRIERQHELELIRLQGGEAADENMDQ